jgi:hypothetical protein
MTTPRFIGPPAPDWKAIDLIHRGSDGVITFHAKADGIWQELCSLPANCLPQLFPQLIPDIERDSFFSLNGFKSPRFVKDSDYLDQQGKPLPKPRRRKEWVRYINAAFTDLDCYKVGSSVGTIVGEVINAQDAGLILPPSIIMRSGYGVWLLWLLASKSGKLYGAFPEKLAAFAKVQRAIQETFAGLGSDTAAMDETRVARIAGSLNCKKPGDPKRVDYWPQINAATGNVNTYTLEELAAWLKVDLANKRPRRFSQSKTGNPLLIERGRKGQAGRWQSAYEQFERLWEIRGTWKQGTRNGAVFILAAILNAKKDRDLAAIENELDELFGDLEQGDERYSRDEFDKAVHSVREGKELDDGPLAKMSDQSIANRLEITPGESAALRSFARQRGWKGWPPASKWQQDEVKDVEPRLTATQLRDRRRRFIHGMAASWREAPPLDRIADCVDAAGLGRPSLATIMRDLRALGIDNPRKWQGRKAGDQTKPLPFSAADQ